MLNVHFPNDQHVMFQNHVWAKGPIELKVISIDVNVTAYEKFIDNGFRVHIANNI